MLGELERQLKPGYLQRDGEHLHRRGRRREVVFPPPARRASIFAALGEHGINIRMISQGPDELNIIVGVDTKDFAPAIQVLYNSFVK